MDGATERGATPWIKAPMLLVCARVKIPRRFPQPGFGSQYDTLDMSLAAPLPMSARRVAAGEPMAAGSQPMLEEARGRLMSAIAGLIDAGGAPSIGFWGDPRDFAGSLSLSKAAGRWLAHGELGPHWSMSSATPEKLRAVMGSLGDALGGPWTTLPEWARDAPAEAARCEAGLPVRGAPHGCLGPRSSAALRAFMERLDLASSVDRGGAAAAGPARL